MLQLTCVVRDTVLVGFQRARTRGNVRCRDNVQEILIGNEGYTAKVKLTALHAKFHHLRASVSSNELSKGWVISGKYGPNENSVITCDKFITI